MYERSILLISDKRFGRMLQNAVKSRKHELENDLPALSCFEECARLIRTTGSTAVFRKDFMSFIKEHGLPFFLAMDFRADLGLLGNSDPHKLKLFHSVLLSYAIVGTGKEYAGGLANLLFFIKPEDKPFTDRFVSDPSFLFRALKTKDERKNSILKLYADDAQRASSFLQIRTVPYPEQGKIEPSIQAFEQALNDFAGKIRERNYNHRVNSNTEVISEDMEPASVYLRPAPEKIIINGEIREIDPEQKELYPEFTATLDGAVTAGTMKTVQKRILDSFSLIEQANPLAKDTSFVIHVPDETVIDGAFASSMGTFISYNMKDCRGLSLRIGDKNLEKLRNSSGFIVIKEFVEQKRR